MQLLFVFAVAVVVVLLMLLLLIVVGGGVGVFAVVGGGVDAIFQFSNGCYLRLRMASLLFSSCSST